MASDEGASPRSTRGANPIDRWKRVYLIATCAVIGAAFAYAAVDWGQWPHLYYYPLAEQWTFAKEPGVAIVYHGLILWGLGGLVTGALVGAVLARVSNAWSTRTLQLFGAWAITAILLGGAYYTWNLWPW